MSTNRKENARHVIDELGGSAKLAERLGYKKHGGVQRVENWKKRGIPASVLLENPSIFSPPLSDR